MQRQKKASARRAAKHSVKPCGVNLKAVPKFEDRALNGFPANPIDPADVADASAEARGARNQRQRDRKSKRSADARRERERKRSSGADASAEARGPSMSASASTVQARGATASPSAAQARGASALNAHASPPDQPAGAPTTSIKATFTRRLNGGFLGKRWVNPPDVFETIAQGVEWIDEEIACDDLDGVARAVEAHAATGEWSVSLGSPREGLDPLKPHSHAAEFYDDVPAWLFWLDIDGLRAPRQLGLAGKLEEGADHAVSLMPEPFRKAGRLALRTTRTGSYPGLLHVRIVFLLDEPRTLAEMKAVAKGLTTLPEFSPKSGHRIIDTGIYTPGRFVFINTPQCAPGVLDPGAKAGMLVKPGAPLDLNEAGHALGVDLARAAGRTRAAGSPPACERRLLDAPEDQRERLLSALVLALPNDLDRNGWIGHLHAIQGASGGAPYGRDIALEFSARWLNGADDPRASALAYDTLSPGENGIDYLVKRAVRVGAPEALAAVAAIEEARRAALEFPPLPGNDPSGNAHVDEHAPAPVDPIIAAMNEEWAFIKSRAGGVFNLKTLRMFKWPDFDSCYANRFALGGGKRKTWAKHWREHPDRREHENVGLYPKDKTPAGCFNLFDGLKVQPQPGAWPKFESYLREVICNADQKAFEALRDLVYWKIQNPTEPLEIAVALIGPPGVGKTKLGQILARIFGESRFVHHTNPEAAASHFNAELEGAILVLFDECFFGHDAKIKGRLKSLITSPTLMIEPKGFDRYPARNSLMVMFASNETAALPIDGDDRRVLVLKVSNAHAEDHAYFADLDAALGGGELAAFTYAALHADLTGFNRRALYRTKARSELAAATASPEAEFAKQFLETGRLPGGDLWPRGQHQPDRTNPWTTGEVAFDGDALQEQYIDFMDQKHRGKPRRNKDELVGEFRRALGGDALLRSKQMKIPGSGGRRASRYVIASLADCRAAYDKHHGRALEWPDPQTGHLRVAPAGAHKHSETDLNSLSQTRTLCHWTQRLGSGIIRPGHVRRGHGCRRVASRSRARPIRDEFPRQQDQRGPAAAVDGRRPQGHRRLRSWRPATAPRRNCRISWRKISSRRPDFAVKSFAGSFMYAKVSAKQWT
jgi:hypothetical protein